MKGSQSRRLPPKMVLADPEGRIFDHPNLLMAAQSGIEKRLGNANGLMPMPEGSQLFTLPGRYPVGWDPESERFVTIKEIVIDGRKLECTAVAAFLAPGYLRCLLPATQLKTEYPTLPLWAYGAVGFRDEGFCVSGIFVDPNPHWHPRFFRADDELNARVQDLQQQYPRNRLVQHLSHCALGYRCFAAKNAFYQRWEIPVPTSPGCNAKCLGCLSSQPFEGCEASHKRISFIPTVEEIVEVALPHMMKAEDPIVSFGQGCEGEPLLQDRLLEQTIATLRERTSEGTINVNTNGSLPQVVGRLAAAGLDAIRITLGSARPKYYESYHKPEGYRFADVLESMGKAKEKGIYLSLNLLVFPGLTDQEDEIEALLNMVSMTGVDMIQMRNLNIDPEWYLKELRDPRAPGIGIPNMLTLFRRAFPHLVIGYFNRTKESFQKNAGAGEATQT